MIGVVKGVEPGRHGLIFVSIMLLPLLASAFTQLKWTNGEAIDERLGKLANFNAVVVVGIDIALMVRQRGTRTPAAAERRRHSQRSERHCMDRTVQSPHFSLIFMTLILTDLDVTGGDAGEAT